MSRSRSSSLAMSALVIAPILGLSLFAGSSVAASPELLPPVPSPTSVSGAGAGTDAEPVTSMALVRVRVETSSDWTAVTFSGRMGGIQLRAVQGAPTISKQANGFTLRTSGTPAALEFDAVLDETSTASSPWIATEKGSRGTTRVTIENRSNTPYMALDALNDRRSTTDPSNRKVFTVDRDQLIGTKPLQLPRVDTDPLVLAFYYPWFNAAVYQDPTLTDRPVARSDVWRYADVLAMSSQARSAGVDGFVVSWAGAAHDRAAFTRALQAAKATSGSVAGVLEVVTGNDAHDPGRPADAAVVERWLRELIASANHPAYLRQDGVPVVFVYEMRRLGPATWRSMLDRLAAEGTPVRLVGDGGPGWAAVSWGTYDYGPWADDLGFRPLDAIPADLEAAAFETRAYAATHPYGGSKLVAATAFPGYDDRRSKGPDRPVVERNGASTYEAMWAAAVGADPDWVLVTSWNEWWEGTGIQPGDRDGRSALDATPALAGDFKRAASRR